jgi:hypothetical protein
MSKQMQPPDALLLMGTHCPWCPKVLDSLQALLADGTIASLEAVKVEEQPELAAELKVRTVPWVRIGPFELEGMRSEQELRNWAEKAGTGAGLESYLDELLSSGGIDRGLVLVRDDDAGMDALLSLFANPDTQLNTRIGISAIMEELQGSTRLQNAIETLGGLTRHADAGVRGDACHYLSLTGDERAAGFIKPLLDDPDTNIREIAQESLDLLANR